MFFAFKSIQFLACAAVVVLMATIASTTSAQVTVPFTATSWQGFGTTNIVGVTGNFLPGWETVVISPDLGVNLFGNANQTLSGAPLSGRVVARSFDREEGGSSGQARQIEI